MVCQIASPRSEVKDDRAAVRFGGRASVVTGLVWIRSCREAWRHMYLRPRPSKQRQKVSSVLYSIVRNTLNL